MGKQAVTVKINPDVLKWIIESGGWEIQELEKKLNVKPETISQWQKEHAIDAKKLEKLADCVKRPLALFFLPEPPTELKLTDYRKLSGINLEKLSRKTILAIRESRYLQSVAKELLESQGKDPKPDVNNVTLSDDPEKIAINERKKLGFESEEGLLSKSANKSTRSFYSRLRETIETFNIFVFQMSVPINEARGFTLSDALPRCIVVNSADSEKPKIFTLLHEYGHILLKKEGICIPSSDLQNNAKNDLQKIERWCNTFAGSVLMPANTFLEEVSLLESYNENPLQVLESLSSKFKASKKAVVVRLLNLVPNTKYAEYYENSYEEITRDEMLPPTKKKRKGGGPDPVNKCLSQKGRKFVSLVLDSKDKKIVNFNDMVDYLNLNIKFVDKLQEKL